MKRLVLLAVFFALVSGCAVQPVYKPMPTEAQGNLQSADVVLGISQKEIRGQIHESNLTAAAGGGLLFALIDAGVNQSRANSAERDISPVKDALLDFDFNKEMTAALAAEFEEVEWVNNERISVITEMTDANYDDHFRKSPSDAVMFVNLDYSLTPDFTKLMVNAQSMMFPKSAKLRALQQEIYSDTTELNNPNKANRTLLANSLYRNTFSYVAVLSNPPNDKGEAAAVWAADNGALIKQRMSDGVVAIAKLIMSDAVKTRDKMQIKARPGASTSESYAIDVNGSSLTVTRNQTGALGISAP